MLHRPHNLTMSPPSLDEKIVDHVPGGTDSTGRSPEEGGDDEFSSEISRNSSDDDSLASARQNPPTDTPRIASKENEAVIKFKIFVYGLIFASAIAMCLGVNHYLKAAEEKEFESTFSSYTFAIFDSLSTQLHSTIGAADAFSLTLSSYGPTSSDSGWPLVSIPDSTQRLSKLRSQTGVSLVTLLHLISDENRSSFEAYGLANYDWANQTVLAQTSDEGAKKLGFKLATEVKFAESISDASGKTLPQNSGPYASSLHTYPLLEGMPAFHVDYPQSFGLESSVSRAIRDEAVTFTDFANSEVFLPVDGATDGADDPVASIVYPIQENGQIVGLLTMLFHWRLYFHDVLRTGQRGIVLVVDNECSGSFTYEIEGPAPHFVGYGDHHDAQYNDLQLSIDIDGLLKERGMLDIAVATDLCSYTIKAYPSATLEDDEKSNVPVYFTIGTFCVFLFTIVVFTLYDLLVKYRQDKVMQAAVESEAILSQLFPATVRDRLFKGKKKAKKDKKKESKKKFVPAKAKMRNMMNEDSIDEDGIADEAMQHDGPIADLFPETTVLFADIAGFTAWSSAREPTQVFTLLEKIYGAFDQIAARRGVFKVETIGDSYVAVCGLPESSGDHALVMTKFADQCRAVFSDITRELDFSLGPETSGLRMRFGLNSGATTAGVLRNQKSRFQLFGDTVNTAARMESTGMANLIQVSQATADLIIAAKKEHWLEARAEKVDVKGKGMMQTYWADPGRGGNSLSASMHSSSVESAMAEVAHRNERMVFWCTDIMAKLLRQIVSRRLAAARAGKSNLPSGSSTIASKEYGELAFEMDMSQHSEVDSSSGSNGQRKRFKAHSRVIEEVVEVIKLPEFDPSIKGIIDTQITLDAKVMKQLREYVTEISGTYRENPFHNFEHASHVTMSVAKLLSRIVAPDIDMDEENAASSLHDYTYGITSDPLTQFACVFAALIHDSDHYGIPNAQLVSEKAPLAHKYKNRSPAEQNSVNIAWKILMKSKFSLLRSTICPTMDEMCRFRQLVVNSVMATDIADKEMKELRNARWAKAFSQEVALSDESARTNINRKATIVIEHLIQASDVAHTMQHWHVYCKWNERLFQEMSLAYLVGRSQTDPVEFWYKGELGFFDFYIIPLAKKLSECGVFGVSSDEYLNYAMRNREEWERRGHEILEGMKARFQEKLRNEYGDLGLISQANLSQSTLGANESLREEKGTV